MTQRPQHGYAGTDAGTTTAGAAPWPVPQPWQQQAAQPPQPAVSPQFQYASNEFVRPGAPAGQAPPMTSHGGTIGTPAGASGTPYGYGHAGSAVVQPPTGAAAYAMHDVARQPQAWAYPTPNGIQLVQPGDATAHHVAIDPALAAGARSRRRVRWETIIPAAAVACLVVSIGIFIADFDRITGRDQAVQAAATTQAAKPEATPTNAGAGAAGGDAASTIATAKQLRAAGRYADAVNALRPLTTRASSNAEAAKLLQSIRTASARNAALVKRLAKEQRDGRWSKVVATLAQVERLHPLSAKQQQLRRTALAKVRAAKAARAAKAKAREGASARPAGPAVRGGGAAPPPAGGAPAPSAPPAARPPSNVSSGEIPKIPEGIPNPTGGSGGSGAAAVGAAPAAAGCTPMVHDGVEMCM